MVSLSLLIQVIPEVTGSSLLSVMDRLAFEVAPHVINKTVTKLGNDNSSCTQGMPKLSLKPKVDRVKLTGLHYQGRF